MTSSIREEMNAIVSENQGLEFIELDEEFQIIGLYTFSLKYLDVVFQGNCEIKFIVKKSFPDILPKLYVENLPSKMGHIFEDGSACVATNGQQIEFISKTSNLLEYWNEFVKSYIFSVEYYREYDCYPYGERVHGAEGLLSYYNEKWNADYSLLIRLAKILVENTYRGHNPCPCGSKNKIRNCHGKLILGFLKKPKLKSHFFNEIASIIDWREKQ